MRSGLYHRGLHWFAIATALATMGLICIGGLVTSKEAGMAVPDWPTTYGYNMFFFPISKWTGGIFYEHTHRLVASVVGFMTILLAVWLWLKDSRIWLRRLGLAAVALVILQGVLGGLRVTEMMDELGIFHATLAQLFLGLVSAIALFTSRLWLGGMNPSWPLGSASGLRFIYAATTALILLQLILGATMRHQHAGLAVPDFPLAYGSFWPDLDPVSIQSYNQTRSEVIATNPITATQVVLHMVHRILAFVVLGSVVLSVLWTRRRSGRQSSLFPLTLLWLGMVLAQIALGAFTVWTDKSADITTIHVAVGASCLVLGVCLLLLSWRYGEEAFPQTHPQAFASRSKTDSSTHPLELPA